MKLKITDGIKTGYTAMRNSLKTGVYTVALFLLIGQTCAKDPDGQLGEEESYVESMYGQKKEIVAADWKKFTPLARKLVSVAESNLKSLRVKIGYTTDGDAKIKWNIICQKGEYQLGQLKLQFRRRDMQFQNELRNYDGTSGKTNTDFKKEWLHQIIELNNILEEALDE